MNFKILFQDYFEGLFEPIYIKITALILIVWSETFYNIFGLLTLQFEKYGGDPLKRSLYNQLFSQNLYAQISKNIFVFPVYIWR